jgi:glucose-6-phosphate 1-dehydrogenase
VTTTEVMVTLKRPPLRRTGPDDNNYYRFRLGPDVIIAVGAHVKKPGDRMASEREELRVVHRPEGEEMDAYERLLGDAMAGDGMLFAREDAVEAAWAVVQPILGDKTPPHPYKPGTWGPAQADRLTEDVGGWHQPQS